MKRWGIATDMNVTLQKTQKSPLLINTYIISVAVILHMQSIANQAQWSSGITLTISTNPLFAFGAQVTDIFRVNFVECVGGIIPLTYLHFSLFEDVIAGR